MQLNDIFFGGHWLSEFGGYLTTAPQFEIAERDIEIIEIPGRSGDLYLDKNRFKNVEFTRSIGFKRKGKIPVEKQIENVIHWLAYNQGYQTFRETMRKGYQTRAILTNLGNIMRISKRLTSIDLQFNRLPFYFSDEGQIPHLINLFANNGEIELYNYETIDAEPIYRFISTSNSSQPNFVTLNIGGKTCTYNFTFGHPYVNNMTEFIIDTADKQIYLRNPITGEREFVNGDLPPNLPPGKSTVGVTVGNGQIKCEIIPNWRQL